VKNNLAMVTSLLRLENERLGDSVDLTDILARITTITAIHEQLQESSTYDTVDLRSYITKVVSNAFSAHPSIAVELDIPRIQIPTKTATTLGLIMNEIATNAEKYGFNDAEPPRFSVTSQLDQTSCEISVTNSGNPFPDDITLADSPSLGLRLVSMLAGQLGGEISLRRTPQPEYTISFPVEAPDDRMTPIT
jgi:two-component sensor histidine kinase